MVPHVEVHIGPYILVPSQYPDGGCIIEITRVDAADAHDHPHGPSLLIDVDDLFAKHGNDGIFPSRAAKPRGPDLTEIKVGD